MQIKFSRLGLIDMGGGTVEESKQQASLAIQFDAGYSDFWPTVEIKQLLDRSDTVTLGELREQAKEFAIIAMKEAIRLLEGHSLEELRQLTADQDKAFDEKAASDLAASLVSADLTKGA